MRRAFVFLAATSLPMAALAGPFDGVYRPSYDFAVTWDCKTVGADGGAVAIIDDVLQGVENSCTLTSPVEVRDMNAILYDAECAGEGETSSERILLMNHDHGIYVIRDGFVADWLRCE